MVGDIHDDFLPSDRLRRRELDVSQLWHRLSAHRRWLIAPAALCFLISTTAVNVIAPRYTGETKLLIESQQGYFSRSDKTDTQAMPLPDDEAVQSQVQLVSSRDLARAAIRQLGLQGNPEFDPLADGIGVTTRLLVLLGLERDPLQVAPEERMLENYFDKLTVFPVNKSRVLTVEFESKDPDLAARAANTIASLYIDIQSSAKRDAARSAADSLRTLIESLRLRAGEAEAKAQAFRSRSGLMVGSNNTTITSQQLGELSTQLSQARSAEADAQAKAKLIRDMIKAGRIAEIPDVANNETFRRMSEQRANLRTDLALQSRTLLPGHPRMKELTAQLTDLDLQLRTAGEKAARTLDNDARIAASRVENLEAAMTTQKETIGATGGDQVKLNELDLNARLLKDQLEFNTSKYQEAVALENAVSTPADARVISRAVAPSIPSYPKKIPIILIATIAGALLSLGIMIARELLSGRAFVNDEDVSGLPIVVETARDTAKADAAEPAAMPAADKKNVDVAAALVAMVAGPPGVEPAPVREAASVVDDDAAVRPSLSPEHAFNFASNRDAFLTTLDAVLALKQPEQALRLFVCSAESTGDAGSLAIRLGQTLSRSFRAIAIDCAETAEPRRMGSIQKRAGFDPQNLPTFGDLLAGRASFAEVIHRDVASRLHFVSGVLALDDMADDEHGVENLLDALAETYDFVVMSGPAPSGDASWPLLMAHCDGIVVETVTEGADERIATLRAGLGKADTAGPMVIVSQGKGHDQGSAQVGAVAA